MNMAFIRLAMVNLSLTGHMARVPKGQPQLHVFHLQVKSVCHMVGQV